MLGIEVDVIDASDFPVDRAHGETLQSRDSSQHCPSLPITSNARGPGDRAVTGVIAAQPSTPRPIDAHFLWARPLSPDATPCRAHVMVAVRRSLNP